MRKVAPYLVALMWAVLLLGGAFRPQAARAGSGGLAERPEVGYAAPPFAAQDSSGRAVALADFKGQAVFLNFWASWCGPCRLEMPEIQRLAADLPPGTTILTVNMTSQESSAATALAYLEDNGFTFPVTYDPSGDVGRTYRVLSLPTSLFVSPSGVVTARINGPLARTAMADYLKEARGSR